MKDSHTLPVILVTGANGQLGSELQQLAPDHPSYRFLFTSKDDLPIDDPGAVDTYFKKQHIDFCINCAAYTAVDKAETEIDKAYGINADGIANIAAICTRHQTKLIHISTDYVFDGTSAIPYKEDHTVAPVNVYGASKLKGEQLTFINCPSAVVIRTSWVYSAYGNNFVKTMIRLMKERENINVINDQYGCPTYAADLAGVIMEFIKLSNTNPFSGIFNFCNQGVITWYEFAIAIKEFTQSKCSVSPVPSSGYITAAKRPQYSVLETSKIQQALNTNIPEWKASLNRCLQKIAG